MRITYTKKYHHSKSQPPKGHGVRLQDLIPTNRKENNIDARPDMDYVSGKTIFLPRM